MTTAVLERAPERALPGPAPLAKAPAPGPHSPGHEQALDAMLAGARRMGLLATDRQIALLLGIAERHLLPPEPEKDTIPHGTMRGYKRHRRRDEPACAPCREACRLASAERRRRKRTQVVKPCGTEAAYHRHVRRFEEPCEPCREAHRTYVREYRERRQQAVGV